MYLCSRIKNKYFKDMKTFNFVFGLFIALFCVLIVVLLDFDLFYTVGKFGGVSAWFVKNPFAGVALVGIIFFNVFFAFLSFVGLSMMRGKEIL